MMKAVKIKNLDCANCASKLEEEIKKIDGVNNVSISFMSQRMMLDIETEIAEKVVLEVKKICKQVEPSCELSGI